MFPRFIVPVFVVAFFSCVDAGAQSAQPRQSREYQPAGLDVPPPQPDIFEASIGFDYLRATSALAKNEYGGDVSLFANLRSWLAIGAEFIGTYGSKNHQFSFNRSTTVDESRLVYVAGPRINVWNRDNLKVYIEGLVGGGHGHVSALIFGVNRSASADGFAAVIGAGAEWKFSRRIAWRVIETDYIPVRFQGEWENDWRVSTGLSFTFGSGW